jgi:hypothetical protein
MIRDMKELEEALWNDVKAEDYAGTKEKYQNAIMDQYKLYVEMADRVSARRALTNTFFITLNSSLLVLLSAGMRNPSIEIDPLWTIGPLVGVLGQCGAWFYLVKSYRQLNSAKYRVIGEIERRLPATPYQGAEWGVLLRQGKDRSKYWRLTRLEQWMPLLFVVVYVSTYLMSVLR